jgi:nitroreductase
MKGRLQDTLWHLRDRRIQRPPSTEPVSWLLRTERGRALLHWIRRRPLLLALYFHFQRSFYKEQSAVLAGQIAYHSSLTEEQGVPVYPLRRNIHRIEKGLSTANRRASFAEAYIEETVDALRRVVRFWKQSPDEHRRLSVTVQWSVDVLSRYFDVVVCETKAICRAREAFAVLLERSDVERGVMYPRARQVADAPCVSYDDLLSLATKRCSTRQYLARNVPRDLIDKALDIARLSPSACNRQPFEFRVYDDAVLLRELAHVPGGASDYADTIPCLVVLVGKLGAFSLARDLHVIYIDASLAAMAFLFGLESVGLSSCCINWPNLPEKDDAVSAILSLAPDERVIMLIAVGFPAYDAIVPYSAKKSLQEIRSFNRP